MTHGAILPTPEPQSQAAATAVTAVGHGQHRVSLNRDLTKGSIPKNLWFLAWPSMVAGVFQAVDHMAELFFAGFLGYRAIASIGVAQTWVQVFNSARMGLDTATRAMIARAIGAKDEPLANYIAMQSTLLNSGIALTFMMLGLFFAEALLRVLGVSEDIVAAGLLYLRWRFVSTTTFTILWHASNLLLAAGDSVTPMKAQGISRVLHVTLMPMLMFGWGLPAFGLAGAAMAASFAQLIAATLPLYLLFSGRSRLHLSFRHLRLDFPLYWRMIRLGAPASVTSAERSVAQLLMVFLVAPFADIALAAYSLSQRLQMFANLGQMGLGQAAGVLVGQNLGAQSVPRARATAWWALGYSVLASLIVGALIFFFARTVLSFFSREEALLAVAVPWVQIMVVGFLALGAVNVFTQIFNTAGDTLLPMVVTLASVWLVELPMAVILSGQTANWLPFGWAHSLASLINLGQFGIAWAIVLAVTFRLVVYLPYFLWAPWAKKKVI